MGKRHFRNLARKERRAAVLGAANIVGPSGKEAIYSHGEILYVSSQTAGEPLVGRSGFTERQLTEISRHGNEVMTRRRQEARRITPFGFLD